MSEVIRPIPAIALRALVPAEHLRLLFDWAASVETFQHSIDNFEAADRAAWMRAVLNPDWEDGRCGGLQPAEAGMWAECGSNEPHDAHDQQQMITAPIVPAVAQ